MFLLVRKSDKRILSALNTQPQVPDFADSVEVPGDAYTYAWPAKLNRCRYINGVVEVDPTYNEPVVAPTKKQVASDKLKDAAKAQGVNAKIADALNAVADYLDSLR